MPTIPLLHNAALDHWALEASAAADFWRLREDAGSIRAAIRAWILVKAQAGPPPSPRGLVPEARLDIPGLLGEGSRDVAWCFASLDRGGEDDETAQWMLAAAAADALREVTQPYVLSAVLDLTSSPLGQEALLNELVPKIDADEVFAERIDALATKIARARALDPGGAFLKSQRACFESRHAEWQRHPDVMELFREPMSELWPSDEEEQFAFALLRRCRPRRYVDLLSQCEVPEIVSGILAEIQRDATAIAEVIRTAPSAVEGNQWNGAILAPIMLQVAYWHLTERVLRDDGDDATLERLINETRSLFTEALSQRNDASWLSLVWSIALLEDLARRSRNIETPPPLRSAANASWQMLDALSSSPPSRTWPTLQIDGLRSEVSIVTHCARILAAMSGDADDLPALSSLIPPTLAEEALSASRKLVLLAPNVEHQLYDVLGWQLAQATDPAAEWLMLWDSSLPFQEAERHRYGKRRGSVDAGPVPKIVWATGLHATFWLRSRDDDAGRSTMLPTLTSLLSDAALEQELTSYVDDPFWMAASAHAVMAIATEVQAGRSPSEDLTNAVSRRAGTTPLFLRIVHSLIDAATPSDLIFEAMPQGRAGLSSLLANACAIGRLDPRFAQQTAKAIEATRALLAERAV